MFEKTLINATVKRIVETSSDTTVDESFYEERQEVNHRDVEDAEVIVQNEPEMQLEQEESQPKLFKL